MHSTFHVLNWSDEEEDGKKNCMFRSKLTFEQIRKQNGLIYCMKIEIIDDLLIKRRRRNC